MTHRSRRFGGARACVRAVLGTVALAAAAISSVAVPASALPAHREARGTLAFTSEVAPSQETYVRRSWELPHIPNNTGTPRAYRPKGSMLREGERPEATGDYVAWSPDGAPAGDEPPDHSPHPGARKEIAHG